MKKLMGGTFERVNRNRSQASSFDALDGLKLPSTALLELTRDQLLRLSLPNSAQNRTQLIDNLRASGTKFTPENVVAIQKLTDGRTVRLETVNGAAESRHINRHADEFSQKGVSQDQIPMQYSPHFN